jgi:hypothetical protein
VGVKSAHASDVESVMDQPAIVEHRREGFLISTDRKRVDIDVVHGFLTNCYWAKGIPRYIVARSIEHALCFGIYDAEGAQVGFARVISDFATIAYVGDVFVLETHRAGRVADAVHRGAPGASRIAALDSDHSRCARTLFASRFHAGEVAGAVYGIISGRRLQETGLKT